MYDSVALGRIDSFEHVPETRELYALITEPYIDPSLLKLQPLTQCQLKTISIDKLETSVTFRIQAIHFIQHGYYTYLGSEEANHADAYSISSCSLDLQDMVRLSVLLGSHRLSLYEYSNAREHRFQRDLLGYRHGR